MNNYKLTDKKRNGFKAFPKALVEGIFWDKVKQKLSDVLENLLSRVTALEAGGSGGGGGASVIVVSSLEEYPTFDEGIVGKDNICQKLGITSQDFDDIADGKILAIRIGHLLLGAVYGELRGLYPNPDTFFIGFGWCDPDSGLCDLNFGYNNDYYYLTGRNWE